MRFFIVILFSVFSLMASEVKKYEASVVPEGMSVAEKKARFLALVEPAVDKVYKDLMKQYQEVKGDIENKRNPQKIKMLKEKYKATTDEELLLALKPHPKSIALAQAAMESSWATSRFFIEAKNIFGMWSANPNEPRIAAGEKRGGTRTIWLRKFSTIEESVREYYKLMARGSKFDEFRELRYTTKDPFKIITKLDEYSEIGEEYIKEIGGVIRHNKFTRFDGM